RTRTFTAYPNENAAQSAAPSWAPTVTATSDDRCQLEDRQVHRDDETADEHSKHHHDQWLEQARHGVDRVVDLGLVEAGYLTRHRIERARFLADRDHLVHHVG